MKDLCMYQGGLGLDKLSCPGSRVVVQASAEEPASLSELGGNFSIPLFSIASTSPIEYVLFQRFELRVVPFHLKRFLLGGNEVRVDLPFYEQFLLPLSEAESSIKARGVSGKYTDSSTNFSPGIVLGNVPGRQEFTSAIEALTLITQLIKHQIYGQACILHPSGHNLFYVPFAIGQGSTFISAQWHPEDKFWLVSIWDQPSSFSLLRIFTPSQQAP